METGLGGETARIMGDFQAYHKLLSQNKEEQAYKERHSKLTSGLYKHTHAYVHLQITYHI